jgi:GT2 family glycosyltransferase
MEFEITASIVLYKNNSFILQKAINSFLNTNLKVKLFLVDNSPQADLKNISTDARCKYIFNNANLGFGRAHNIVLKNCNSKYHIILNPDVYFDEGVLENIFSYMETHIDVGTLMPKVLYPNGEIQYSGKLLPSPLDLLLRRVLKSTSFSKKRNSRYELRCSGYSQVMNVPNHLGCFMFIRITVLEKSGLFDEDIFMYNEDIDITRRIHKHYKTIFYPDVHIYHHYEKGSKKSLKLFAYHLKSTIIYFNKWGWFVDRERSKINKKLVNDLSNN